MMPYEGANLRKTVVFTDSLKYNLSTGYYSSISYNAKHILQGHCIVVDPSSGGRTSLPSYAVMDKGEITEVGEIPVPEYLRHKASHSNRRLGYIGSYLIDKFGKDTFDVLIVELLYHTPQENTVMKSFQSLTMSIGAIHATIKAKYRMVIPPWEWYRNAPEGYVKTDLSDVRLMAKTLIADSKRYLLDSNIKEDRNEPTVSQN